MKTAKLLLLTGTLGLFSLLACQQDQNAADQTTQLGYRDYLKSGNFVYVHGETADSSRLGDDRYIEDNLDYLFQRHDWVLVNFSAYWCKDCRKFEPDFKAVSQLPEYKDILFAYAEVDGTKGNEKFRARFKLPGVPATILFHKGQIPQLKGQPAILFGQRGDKSKTDLLALLQAFYKPQ